MRQSFGSEYIGNGQPEWVNNSQPVGEHPEVTIARAVSEIDALRAERAELYRLIDSLRAERDDAIAKAFGGTA